MRAKNSKKTKIGKKRTGHMCPQMLRWIRIQIGFAPRDMCKHLGIPRRTYQDYEAGHRGIPVDIADAARQEYRWNKRFLESIAGRVDEGWEREGWETK